MKIFIILSLLFFKEIWCANLSVSDPDSNECQKEKLQLLSEVGQLRKSNGDLTIEVSKLKLELIELREKNNVLTKEQELKSMNCSVFADEAAYLSQNLKSVMDEVKHFNTLAAQHLEDYKSKCETNSTNTTVEETDSISKKLTGLKFVDKTMYEKACDAKKSNGEWTVIQRRIDGSVNFTRGWNDYKVGFGTYTGEFFIGLDNLHMLTTCTPQELIIEMKDRENEKGYAQYDLFLIGDESEKYKMKELGNYKGDVGDSLKVHKYQMFSTFDQDNDSHPAHCARTFKGGWWYNACFKSSLNGEYGNNNDLEGIIWFNWHRDYYSLKKVEMKIRPKN